jgi:hypothetical protein
MCKAFFLASMLLGLIWSVSPIINEVAGLYLGTPSLIQTA